MSQPSALTLNPAPKFDGASPTCVRLTPRGQSLLGALAALVCIIAFVMAGAWGGAASAAGDAVAQSSSRQYTVAEGDTLWDIATALDPQGDPRPLVDQLQRMNGLTGSALSVGQRLLLP